MTNRGARAVVVRKRLSWIILLGVWLITVAAGFFGGAFAYKYRNTILSYVRSDRNEYQITSTSLYDISIRKVLSPAREEDGSIVAIEHGTLLSNGRGQLWFVDDSGTFRPLALRIPINREEFESDPDNANVVFKNKFSVKDLLIANFADQTVLVASHSYWDVDQNCYGLRVSHTVTTIGELEGNDKGATSDWKTAFDSLPCLPLSAMSGKKTLRPTINGGGRLIQFSPTEVLVTVGDFGSYKRGRANLPQEVNNSYGKTILIDLRRGTSRIYSIGHRNPQGLTMRANSEIWSTEHGPQGGDELNLIRENENYGFPYVTYGTEYETDNWPLNRRQGAHDGYAKPVFSWVPSIATSELIEINGTLFSLWKGDLMISSLRARTLYRARIEDGRVVVLEPIEIGHRIRDIVESHDGKLVLKTDDGYLIYLQPTDLNSLRGASPSVVGKYLAIQCQGCHTFDPDGQTGIGPNLFGVVGRPIAMLDDFEYSPALKSVEGRWTASQLKRFLKDPESFAPGTAMQFSAPLTDEQIDSLVAYLETLQ